jgi:hypothetical protein
MKTRLLVILSIGFALVGASCLVASLRLFRAHAVALHAVERIRDALNEADSVELISLLDKQPGGAEKIVTAESGGEYYLGDRKTLSEGDAKELISLLTEHVYTTEAAAGCHDPGQMLILRKKGRTLIQFTLCLKCTNIEFYPYPFLGAAVMIYDRQPASGDLARLKAFVEKHQSEASK